MDAKKLTGPKAGSLKYDLLTAVTVAGLHGSQGFQTSMTRLVALITARYNWRLDEVTVGQRDMARMWGVNERTVKREIKRLLECEFIICKRPGVRGRVAAYRLNYPEIYRTSQSLWAAVGPDFEERMGDFMPDVSTSVVKVDFLRKEALDTPSGEMEEGPQEWRHVLRELKSSEPDLYSNWYAHLELSSFDGGQLQLKAPNKFVARYVETHLSPQLLRVVEARLGPVTRLVLTF